LAAAEYAAASALCMNPSEIILDTGYSSDVAFTPTVKAIQSRKGSRLIYARQEEAGGWATEITDDVKAFIEAQTSFFLATASKDGQPYVQHRGGPAGFLHVLDARTLAFANFAGNRQFITQGNLEENPKAHIFLIDYVHRRRVKIWGTARVAEDDASLMEQLMPQGYAAHAEQIVLFTVSAWDANCPQHIPQRVAVQDVAEALALRDERIATLEAELIGLRAMTS
jgi:uncharacterized protein